VFLDATSLKARIDGRVVSRAVVIATGVSTDGGREVLGLDVGDSEDGALWTAFLPSLKARGLTGVQLVVSDAHTGLKQAIAAVMAGAGWQRCRVHFLRNVLARVPRGSAEMAAAAIRTIFAQPTGVEVVEQLDKVAVMLAPKFPAVARMLTDARQDLTALASFPPAHWTKLWSTNPLERVNKEIKRRSRVVGIFPNAAAVIRLVGAVLIDMHDEWIAGDRRYLSEESMALINDAVDTGDHAAIENGE
jgi:putative transposase